MASSVKRGAFIVFEGCDRSGKSTQSRVLSECLKAKGLPVKHMNFPARESDIGKVINAYITNIQDLSDECIHLLFSANRWEFKNEMKTLLESGTTVVVDRYSYSGVAYSVAKGLNYDWCMSPEKGLLHPDAVFYLKAPTEKLMDRGQYGEERYETRDFQQQVSEVFDHIYEQEHNYWHKVDASLSKNDLSLEIVKEALEVLRQAELKPLQLLK